MQNGNVTKDRHDPYLRPRTDARYVVLGAGGFVGCAMVERLVRQQATVVPVIRRYGAGSAFLARFGLRQQIADLRNKESLKGILDGADTVFHCVTGDRASNVEGLANALDAACSAKVRRFIHISSAVVYGNRPEHPLVEDSTLNPSSSSGYAVSKVAADKIISEWRNGPETVVLRPSIIYGPRSKYWSEAPGRQIVAGTAYLVDRGSGHMNSIHIEHLLDAMLLAAHHPKAANRTYVLQDGFGLTWGDYYTALCELLGARPEAISDFTLEEVRQRSSTLRQYGQWVRDTPRVLKAAVWADPLKAWLKRAPGFEVLRARLAAGGANGSSARAAIGSPSQVIPELETALLQTFPQPIVDRRIREELGFTPRLSFAESMEGLRRWYQFMGLVR